VFCCLESDFEIRILTSEIKYLFGSMFVLVQALKAPAKVTGHEISRQPALDGAERLQLASKLRELSLEEKKKEASKPLFLTRYE